MLLRFDPFREIDRMTGQTVRDPAVPMDAIRRGDTVVVHFDLPGVDPASIDLEVERNLLTLKAERRWARSEGEQVLASERRQGTFSRQLYLGDQLAGDRVAADYADGVLTVTIPVAETAKARKVEIGHTSSTAAIDAEASVS